MVDVEVLKLALSKEEESIGVYKNLMAEHSALKDLLYFLINEEQKHKILIEKKIEELTR